jgi:hypothetical protein
MSRRKLGIGLLLALGLMAADARADEAVPAPGGDALAWIGGLSYRGDTPRREGRLAGIAGDVRLPGGWVADAGFEAVDIAMRFGPKIRQDDVTLGLAMPVGWWSRVRVGMHESWDPERSRLQSQSAWADGTTTGTWWAVGCGAAVSTNTVAVPAVRTAQVSPHAGMSQGWGDWQVGLRAGAILQALDRDPGVGAQRLPGTGARVAVSGDGLLSVGHGAWGGTLSGWCGRRCYAVLQDGYEIDDCPALYRGGFAASAGWHCRHASVSVAAGREFFHPVFATGEAHIDHVVFTIGGSF